MDPSAPVVVGGVGGSGTRLVTEILTRLGYDMGGDLNGSLDNLTFTFFFRRPEWFVKNSANAEEFSKVCQVFQKAMTRDAALSWGEFALVLRTAFDRTFQKSADPADDRRAMRRALWSLQRVFSIGFSGPKGRRREASGWGWKEPNSLVMLEPLSRYFQDLKYIHVIRHGLDMAVSENRHQFYRWGAALFGVTPPPDAALLPNASLRYWVLANRRTIETAERLLGGRFLVLNYDALCVSPGPQIEKLTRFLGREPGAKLMEELRGMPKKNVSIGRYKNHDIRQFDETDLAAVRELGFVV